MLSQSKLKWDYLNRFPKVIEVNKDEHMFKLRSAIWSLIKLYVKWALKDVEVVAFIGPRRSGNHACINWLANSYCEADIKLELKEDAYYLSDDQNIVHLNNVNTLTPFDYVFLIQTAKLAIKNAQRVFISVEDYLPEDSDIYLPKKAQKIFITRGILSLVSSRITWNIKHAKNGLDYGAMSIDEDLFILLEFIHHVPKMGKFCWDYDKWLDSSEWRGAFLNSLSLSCDIRPGLSSHGGGSSFFGTDYSNKTINTKKETRWKAIEWPDRVIDLLSSYGHLLSPEETAFIKSLG